MKRVYSGSDLEDDEEYNTERCLDGEDDETTARKRRRGLIEKKRRDRINSCLTELRRLVPAAVDKQGSTKLEKAEILQLTVDHLRNVRNISKRDTGSNEGANFRAAGFRECLSEVSRYLQSFQDPNCKEDQKVQLMSHLNTIIMHRLTAPPSQVYQSRTSLTPPVAWPLTRGISAQPIYHDTTTFPLNAATKMKTEQQNSLHENQLKKDKSAFFKNQNVVISQVSDVGVRPVQSHFPFTMYPTHCSDNLIIGIPFIQQRNDLSKSDKIIFGTNGRTTGIDPSLVKAVFCQHF